MPGHLDENTILKPRDSNGRGGVPKPRPGAQGREVHTVTPVNEERVGEEVKHRTAATPVPVPVPVPPAIFIKSSR